MAFYFTVHFLLGFLAGNSVNIIMKAQSNVAAYPLWLNNSLWSTLGSSIMVFSAILAIPTTFFQWGLTYTMATLGELVLGAFIVGFFPIPLRIILVAIGPIISIAIMGALWGFWYLYIPFIS